jgi:hypothetical protein
LIDQTVFVRSPPPHLLAASSGLANKRPSICSKAKLFQTLQDADSPHI